MSELTTMARPYARAVFELARDSKSLDVWSDRLQYLAAVVSDPAMTALLDTPQLTHQQRASTIEDICGEQLDESGRNFVRLIAENGRVDLMGDIQALFEEYRSEAQGSIEATVISASALNEEQTQKIADALSKRLERQVNVVSSIDPDLIAGAIIRAGDLVIDGSLKGRLQNLTQQVSV